MGSKFDQIINDPGDAIAEMNTVIPEGIAVDTG
jgi:hypothetical protein